MNSGKSVSIGHIMYKVLRHPLAQDLAYDQAAEFALEFIRLVGAPLSFIDEVKKIEIKNYKGSIPSNLINVRGVKYVGENDCDNDGIAMRYATDLYHSSGVSEIEGFPSEFTYTLQNCVITTSFNKGFVEISYKAIGVDENGYPLVPDNESFKFGLEYFIMWRHLEALWSMGKITDKVFQYYEQKKMWYLGQAGTSLMLSGIDHLESMMRGLNRILIQDNAHENFYKNFGEKQRFKTYN